MRTSSPVRIFRRQGVGPNRRGPACHVGGVSAETLCARFHKPSPRKRTLSLHPETTFTAAITATANLLVTVTCRDLAALYAFVTTKVGPLPAVRQVETVPVLHRLKQAGTRVRDGRLSAT